MLKIQFHNRKNFKYVFVIFKTRCLNFGKQNQTNVSFCNFYLSICLFSYGNLWNEVFLLLKFGCNLAASSISTWMLDLEEGHGKCRRLWHLSFVSPWTNGSSWSLWELNCWVLTVQATSSWNKELKADATSRACCNFCVNLMMLAIVPLKQLYFPN